MTAGVTVRVRVTLDVDLNQPWSITETASRIREAAERDAREQLQIALVDVHLCRVVGIEIGDVTLTIRGGQ
jgi:hypothetical protein